MSVSFNCSFIFLSPPYTLPPVSLDAKTICHDFSFFRANVISGKTEEEHGQSHHHPEEHLKEDLRHQISDQLKDEQRQISQRLDSLEMILSDKFKGQSDLLKKEQKHSEKQLSERLDSLEMILKDKLKHQSDRLEEEQKKMSQRLESLETILLDIKSRL